MYGEVTLQENLTIGEGETLTIPEGSSLTVPDGKTLTNNGTVTVEEGGTLTNNGSLDCNHHTGGTATCTEKAKCDLCGAEYGDFLPHSLTKTEAKAPTCTVVGNEAYWTCGNCGKYFSDGKIPGLLAQSIMIGTMRFTHGAMTEAPVLLPVPAKTTALIRKKPRQR